MASRTQITDRLAKEFGSRDKAGEILDKVLDAILRETHGAERLRLTGFGTFTRVHLPARWARNPQTGEKVWVQAKHWLKFTPGQGALDFMNMDELPEGNIAKKAPKYSLTPRPDSIKDKA